MKFYKANDYADMSRKAANIIAAQLITKPTSVLGLATGSSPIGTYKELIAKYQQGELDFSEVKTVNLDEYKGLRPDNDQSYHYFMNHHLFQHVNINPEATNFPDGTATDDEKECKRYNQVLQDFGGIDLQLLGIGHNGHIGFNEPDDSFEPLTHVVSLTESTINANSRLFSSYDEVPTQAFTMGIKSIMQADKILLIASGKDKAPIIKQAFFGPITPSVPASILQLHKNVSIVADMDALSEVLDIL